MQIRGRESSFVVTGPDKSYFKIEIAHQFTFPNRTIEPNMTNLRFIITVILSDYSV